MAEYRIGFAQEMSNASNLIVAAGSHTEDAQRAALYIGLVACEVALKAALEKSGKPVSEIKASNHDLTKLLDDLATCTVPSEITPGTWERISASCICATVVDSNYADATIGKLLKAEQYGASRFPNEIRYGDALSHFPASVIARLSEKVVAWVKLHIDDIQAEQVVSPTDRAVTGESGER